MKFKVLVKPNSKEEKIVQEENLLVVHTKSPADKNKANLSVLKLLKKYFNRPVRIRSGFASRNKIIETIDEDP